MKRIIIPFLLLFAGRLIAQPTVSTSEPATETGMHFEHASWDAIKAKAKAEHKNIFMDAFTTWCGPCKMMAKNIFPLPEAGEFFNANYINVKVQLDTTKNDNDYVKGWYKDAHDIMINYGVRVFPTYLFISPEGKLLHRAVGASDVAAFIQKGKDALDPDKQYYTLIDRYNAGEKNPVFLKALSEAAYNAYDKPGLATYSTAYFAAQSDMSSPENIRFVDMVTESSKDPGFAIIRKDPAAYNAILGEGAAEKKVRDIVFREEVGQILRSGNSPDWTAYEKNMLAKYPDMGKEISSYTKIMVLRRNQDWPAFSKEVTSYLKTYANRSSPEELNAYAWNIFENCNDMACVEQALDWSKKSVDLTSNPMFIDTYANLLYKNGKKEDAIRWEEKAVTLVKEKNEDASGYETSLDKMKKGEKTW